MAIAEGKPAPPFALEDAAGGRVSLEGLKGKNVVVFFYPKDDTPGCTKEACAFRDLWREIKATGTVILGVSPDDAASHRAFATKYELPFTLLSDPSHEMMETYGAWGKKVLYGKTRVGVIRSTVWIDPDGVVVRHWKRVPDAVAHPEKVLEALIAGGPS